MSHVSGHSDSVEQTIQQNAPQAGELFTYPKDTNPGLPHYIRFIARRSYTSTQSSRGTSNGEVVLYMPPDALKTSYTQAIGDMEMGGFISLARSDIAGAGAAMAAGDIKGAMAAAGVLKGGVEGADKLEILVIVKMPFSNPYNPIVQAKIDQFADRNLDPFMDYQLSEAVLKLKQGIGRLIRRKDDMGICIVTDTRILKKKYGEIILDSLPVFPIKYKYPTTIIHETENFLGI